MSAFTYTPPTHYLPQRDRFVPTAVYEIPPVPALTISASNVSGDRGKEVCVELKAAGFEQILSMQYSMKWDNKVLKFKEVRGFGLPGLSANNFGTSLVFEQGVLTFSWYDQQLRGLSKPDGVKMYEVCFEVVGEAGNKSPFEITSEPTVIEITNGSSQFLQLKTENGSVQVGGAAQR